MSNEVAISCLAWIVHSAVNDGTQLSRYRGPLRPPLQRKYTTVGDVPTLATLHTSLLRFSILYLPFYYLHSLCNDGKEEALQELFKKVMLEINRSKECDFWINRYRQSSGVSLLLFQDDRLIRPYSKRPTIIETWNTQTLFTRLSLDAQFVARHPVNPNVLYNADGLPSRVFAAATFGLESVIIVATDAEIEEKIVFKQTNLQVAAARGHEGVVKALLERKTVLKDINVSSCRYDTFWDLRHLSEHESWSYGAALHFAFLCDKGGTKIIEALIQAGADVEAKDSTGQTPKDMGIRSGREDYLKALEKLINNPSLGVLVQA